MGIQIVGFHGGTGKGCFDCGCSGCAPCQLPSGSNLVVSWVNYAATSGSTPLIWVPGPNCDWASSCQSGFTNFRFFLHCDPICSYFYIKTYSVSPPGCVTPSASALAWESTGGCSGLAYTGILALNTSLTTCSPLNIVWGGSTTSWTVTL